MTIHFEASHIDSLIQPDRVHRDVYLDPEIFDLEMERIFERTWIYVGHDSQVPNPGDFRTAMVGRQPVVMCRHGDGSVRVLFNRCGHRGALVVSLEQGSAKQFRCSYHGWTFDTDGSLAGVPMVDGYGPDFDIEDPTLSMMPLPRVASFHGFVFASLAADGPDLEAYLGPARRTIEEIIERSPSGEVEIRGGVHRYFFEGNWKLQVENLCDMYHPTFSHESTVNRQGRQFQRRNDDPGAPIMERDGSTSSFWDETGMWALPNGHTFQGPMPRAGEPSGPVWEAYMAALEARIGEDRARQAQILTRHNTVLYPSVAIQSLNLHVRTVRPVAVGVTEVSVYPLLLKGAPEAMHQEIIQFLNLTHAAASLIQTDDLECFERQQIGLSTQASDWVLFGRHAGGERPDDNEGGVRGGGTNELGMRNQHRAWLDYMRAA